MWDDVELSILYLGGCRDKPQNTCLTCAKRVPHVWLECAKRASCICQDMTFMWDCTIDAYFRQFFMVL